MEAVCSRWRRLALTLPAELRYNLALYAMTDRCVLHGALPSPVFKALGRVLQGRCRTSMGSNCVGIGQLRSTHPPH